MLADVQRSCYVRQHACESDFGLSHFFNRVRYETAKVGIFHRNVAQAQFDHGRKFF